MHPITEDRARGTRALAAFGYLLLTFSGFRIQTTVRRTCQAAAKKKAGNALASALFLLGAKRGLYMGVSKK